VITTLQTMSRVLLFAKSSLKALNKRKGLLVFYESSSTKVKFSKKSSLSICSCTMSKFSWIVLRLAIADLISDGSLLPCSGNGCQWLKNSLLYCALDDRIGHIRMNCLATVKDLQPDLVNTSLTRPCFTLSEIHIVEQAYGTGFQALQKPVNLCC